MPGVYEHTGVLALLSEHLGDPLANLVVWDANVVLGTGSASLVEQGEEAILSDVELFVVGSVSSLRITNGVDIVNLRAGIPCAGRWGRPCCGWRGRDLRASCW